MPDGQMVIIGRKAQVSHAVQNSGPSFVLQVSKGYISNPRLPSGVEVQINYTTNNRIRIQKKPRSTDGNLGKGRQPCGNFIDTEF